MAGMHLLHRLVLLAIGAVLLVSCTNDQRSVAKREAATSPSVEAAPTTPSPAPGGRPTPVPPTPTPETEKRVTLTTTTTLRDLAAELTRQLGVEYAADDDVAQTTISVNFTNATRAEVETQVREKTKVRLIYSDREIPEQWVHFASPMD